MTYHRSSSLASCRRRLMASAASLDPSLLPVASRRLETPFLIGNWEDCFPSPYLTGNWWSERSAVREFCSERLRDLPTAQESPTSPCGYSTRPRSGMGFLTDLPSPDKLCETLTIPELKFSDIELQRAGLNWSNSLTDALVGVTREWLHEAFMGLTSKASQPSENSGCLRSSRSRTPRGG